MLLLILLLLQDKSYMVKPCSYQTTSSPVGKQNDHLKWEKGCKSQVWFVPIHPPDFITFFYIYIPAWLYISLWGLFSFLPPHSYSKGMKLKHKFAFSFSLEHCWLLWWENTFTGHFCGNSSNYIGKSLKVMFCSRQMSPYFWAQGHCKAPALGFSFKYVPSDVHSEARIPTRLSWSTDEQMMWMQITDT